MENISQSDLVNRLVAIFPAFAAEWAADNEGLESPSNSLHSVYLSFLPFVSRITAADKQWESLAKLLNAEVKAGGSRENAVGTCFLEHCGQTDLIKRLRPLLDAPTRRRLHA